MRSPLRLRVHAADDDFADSLYRLQIRASARNCQFQGDSAWRTALQPPIADFLLAGSAFGSMGQRVYPCSAVILPDHLS